jgi:hypothetical protein
MMKPNIYDYVKSEENKFETQEIRVADNWNWSFRNHGRFLPRRE